MKVFFASGQYTFEAATELVYEARIHRGARDCFPSRKAILERGDQPSGSFIGCDNPVTMDGPKGKVTGFVHAEIVMYQLSRHVLLYGGSLDIAPPFANRNYIARMNTFAMLRAQHQVYSHVPDFCWLDGGGQV